MRLPSRASLILVSSIAVGLPCAAQTPQPAAAAKEPAVFTPELKPFPEMRGWKAAFLQGSTDGNGHRFLVPSLDVLQPVAVILVPLNKGDDLTLKLFRDDFAKPLREASTRSGGSARFQVRTHGPLRMTVSSNGGVKGYQLIVMVGDEVPVPVPSLFVPMSHAGAPPATGGANASITAGTAPGAADGTGTPIVLWIIAGCLVLITVMAGAFLLRKKGAARSAAILMAIGSSALAPSYGSSQEYDPLKPPEPIPQQVVLDEAKKLIKELMEANEESAKVLEVFEALTGSDADAWPDYTPPGMPGLPTACLTKVPSGVAKAINEVEWTGPCGECFVDAHKDLAAVLQRFEKLRRVHKKTEEVHKTALAFGDGAAGVGGIILTAQWMKTRAGIKAEMEKYYGVYDAKVEELTEVLIEALKKVAACEQKYFNNANWYDRYGFMFVTPVVDRHRR